MLAPISWLKDYVDNIPADIKTFCDRMTITGTKVENYEYRGTDLYNIVTARVEDIKRHENSDHMWICEIYDGTETCIVVTGAQNVHKGDIVPFARNNSTVHGGKKIKASNLRGIKSYGMLCSGEELGLTSSIIPKHQENGIYILDPKTPLGVDIKDILGLDDYVVEFELTNNRQDCNSIIGVASEVSAAFGKRFNFPNYEFDCVDNEIDNLLKVTVKEPELCPRYTAKMVKVKKVEESPLWMQTRLMAAGVRPINNIVDVSNFVMLETGQPLHTFDYDKLSKGEIIVSLAQDEQSFTTLDGTERILNKDVLMINDGEKAVAIAGIMGGGNSDIDDHTKMVVIEAANFNKQSIRRSSNYLGLRSESSAHFEKGITPYLTKYAADRAASLLVEIGAAEYVDGVIDCCIDLGKPKEISFDIDWLNSFLGIKITENDAKAYLDLLNFKTTISNNQVIAVHHEWRQDIELKEDLAEEVARMYGYENIPLTMMESSNYISPVNKRYQLKQRIKNILVSVGGIETLTYSFISPDFVKDLKLDDKDSRSDLIVIRNPLGFDNSVMRTTLIPNMIDLLKTNINKKNADRLMFEIGNIYAKNPSSDELPVQLEHIIIGKNNIDFYELKNIINYITNTLNIEELTYKKANEPFLHPGRSAYIYLNDTMLGFIGQIHPSVAVKYDIPFNICLAELSFDEIFNIVKDQKNIIAKQVGKYPAVLRDIAVVCNEDVEVGELKSTIKKYGGKNLISCNVFDVYRNITTLGVGKKSIAFNLKFRSDTETLTDDMIEKTMNEIITGLAHDNNALLR